MKNKVKKLMSRFSLLKGKKDLKKEELIDELNRAYSELQNLYQTLADANQQKTLLLEELQAQKAVLERQNSEDSLTGMYNRRFIDLQLVREFIRAQRYNRNLTVIMADLDHFKRINDDFGHQTGDQVLMIVAQILKESCREVDFIARYGGEEFLLLLPETPSNGAIFVCERIRKAVEGHDWDQLANGLKVTISQGIAYNTKVESHLVMLRHADAKLYEAKRAGRNTVKY
ncbi:GGDEF domain-containing protein [candidate division TA06 bacterium]|nr:GGDEF domain-containing protein [candidate division TA06 bacterium]